jgi:hypothetical protein
MQKHTNNEGADRYLSQVPVSVHLMPSSARGFAIVGTSRLAGCISNESPVLYRPSLLAGASSVRFMLL